MITATKINDKVVIVEAKFQRFGKEVKIKCGSNLILKKLAEYKAGHEAQIAQHQAHAAEVQNVIDEIKNNADVKALPVIEEPK